MDRGRNSFYNRNYKYNDNYNSNYRSARQFRFNKMNPNSKRPSSSYSRNNYYESKFTENKLCFEDFKETSNVLVKTEPFECNYEQRKKLKIEEKVLQDTKPSPKKESKPAQLQMPVPVSIPMAKVEDHKIEEEDKMDAGDCFISCSNCQLDYDSPRFLPCGESICSRCIIKSTKFNEFSCCYCKKAHIVPHGGFPVNKQLDKLVNKFETDLYRGPTYQEFKTSLGNIQHLLADLKYYFSGGTEKIQKYCENLTNQVDLVTEKQIKEINEYRDVLLSEIKNYENECLNSFRCNQENFERDYKLAVEVVEKEKSSLNKMKFDEEKLRDKISRIKDVEWKLSGDRKKIKNKIFKNTEMVFMPNDLVDPIGKIIKKNISKINRKNLKFVDLAKHLTTDVYSGNYLGVELMDNGNFIFDYLDKNESNWIAEIHCFEEGKKYFKCLTESIDGEFYKSIIKPFKDRVIFYIDANLMQSLKITDDSLKIACSKSNVPNIKSIVATDDQILCLIDGIDSQILIFDWNLFPSMVVNKSSSYFYFPRDLKSIYSNDEYFFFRETDRVNVINKSNRCLVKNFTILEDYKIMSVHSNYLISSQLSENKIHYLDFNGNAIETEQLINFANEKLRLFVDKSENLHIVDCKNLKIFTVYK